MFSEYLNRFACAEMSRKLVSALYAIYDFQSNRPKRCGQGFPWPFTQSGEHSSQSPIQAQVAQITSRSLVFRPSCHARTRSVEVLENESC